MSEGIRRRIERLEKSDPGNGWAARRLAAKPKWTAEQQEQLESLMDAMHAMECRPEWDTPRADVLARCLDRIHRERETRSYLHYRTGEWPPQTPAEEGAQAEVEAMLTHALSTLYDVAHSPMFETRDIADMDPGVVDPRMAAEAISATFLQCILKGLMRSPRIVRDAFGVGQVDVITAANVSCLIVPDGCIGLPTLAALHQGIPVIAVRENRNILRNDLRSLPWREGQLWVVDNYWEVCGILASLKAGIAPESVRRPLAQTRVQLETETLVTPSASEQAELASRTPVSD